MSFEVQIEQKIDVPGRLFFFSTDDALVALIPVAIGFLSRNLIPGFFVGIVAYFLWRKLKGEGGLERLKALVYVAMPPQISPYRSFPRSDVVSWRG